MNYKFNEIKDADEYEISEITDIILLSNQTSLIAKLGKNFVKKFIKLCIVSKNVKLFTLCSDKTNIAYAIFFKKETIMAVSPRCSFKLFHGMTCTLENCFCIASALAIVLLANTTFTIFF